MSAKNSSDHTKMDAQDHNNETGNDKTSRHDHQQNLNHPSGLHPAKIRKPTSDPVDKSSNRSMKKQMEVAVGETEEKTPTFKRAKGNSKAAAKDVGDNGYENDDLKPLNVVTTRGSSIKANQDRPIYSKIKVTEPNNETSSGAIAYSDLEIEKDCKKTDVMTITQVEETRKEDIPGTDDDSTSNQKEYLPLSNNQPVYGAEEDHEIQSSSELSSHRPERYEIRKRRHEAFEGVHEFTSTASAEDNDNSLVTFAVNQIELDTIQKLLEDVVEEAQRRKRRSIQETNQQEPALEPSATNEVEQAISPATNSPDIVHSLSPDAYNDGNRIAQDHASQAARQSCKEMDYTEEQIDHAVNEYHRLHGGSNDYSGHDLASLMEMRQDEVQDAPDDQSPPPIHHTPPSDNRELVSVAAGDGQYQVIATITDNGHPYDDSTRHTIHVDVQLKRCNCGCEPEIIRNFYFP